MQQRLTKIIVPDSEREVALKMISLEKDIYHWIEESDESSFVINVLNDSSHTEKLMDKFERKFGKVEGFRLIVFPVEASIPRKKEEEKPEPKPAKKKKKSTRISREELYADIVGSSETSTIYIIFVILSTVVAAIGLLKNNAAVIIGAMVIAPFLGPNVALALSATLADTKLRNNALKALVIGIALVIMLSAAMGFFFPFDLRFSQGLKPKETFSKSIALLRHICGSRLG